MKQGALTGSSQTQHNPALAKATEKPIRVLIVDTHPLARMGLRSLLAQHRHIIAIGETGDGQDALSKAKELLPDVVLMDMNMPRLDGLSATAILCRDHPKMKIIIFAVHFSAQCAQRILASG